jgi:MBG domain (YGX type)
MIMKRITTVFLAVALIATIAPNCFGQYTTDWVANTFGTNATRVGNVARSMWVAPEGVVYTASMWDENAGSIAIYQNGQGIGFIGAHADSQGGAITGNSTSIFTPLQFTTTFGSGKVGRYNRSTKTRDLIIAVSATTTERRADVITGLATSGPLLYASDLPGNRVRIFTTDGIWQKDISVSGPGALAVDSAGDIWVAQKSTGTILEFNPSGVALNTIQMGASSRPSALYFDVSSGQLMVGDEGPDMNIKLYNISGTSFLADTFGVQGGYLDTTTGVKGQVGAKRFTRVVGIGKDTSGNLYVLNNPYGGSWDLGRDGGTDIHSYDISGALKWTLQSLNFEAVADPDSGTDGAYMYSAMNVYTGSGGAGFVANTVDPITYPSDPRIAINVPGRGEHFGMLATVGSNRILVAAGQNSDGFDFFYFNPATGYIAIPYGTLPGPAFNTTARIRYGFCLDSKGDIWAGLDKTNAIWHYPLLGFDSNGKPTWGVAIRTPTPSGTTALTRIIYLPESDTMILGRGIVGSIDWTSIGTTVEVYRGWLAGNTTAPTQVITISSPNPKSIAAAGNYLFVGYVHTVPNIDAFNLTTAALETTFINSNPDNVYVGNDVDSMYGIRAYRRSTGEYMVTKDNYNGTSIIIYRWTPGVTGTTQTINFPPVPNVAYGTAPIALQATSSSSLPVTYTVTGPAVLSGQNLTITGAGSVTVTANQSGNSSYAAASPVARTFTVAPAVLTISAQNLSMAYGAALPALVSSTAGFVNGDSASVLTGAAALTTTATSTSPVGAYTITAAQGTLAAANYNFVFVNGVLDIFGGRR